MRGILETVAVAFSMFSALPMPQISWEKRNMRYALCAFPLVGGVIGGLCWLWGELCQCRTFCEGPCSVCSLRR